MSQKSSINHYMINNPHAHTSFQTSPHYLQITHRRASQQRQERKPAVGVNCNMQPSPEAHIPNLNPELKMRANVGRVNVLREEEEEAVEGSGVGWGRVGVEQLKKTWTPTVMLLRNVIPNFLAVMSFLICDGWRIVTVEWGGVGVGVCCVLCVDMSGWGCGCLGRWSMTHPYGESVQNKRKEPFQHQIAGQLQRQPLSEEAGAGARRHEPGTF